MAADEPKATEAAPADDSHVIGMPSPPPPALVVALSGQLTETVRRARLKQFVRNTLGILLGTVLAATAALLASRFCGNGRNVAFAEAAVLGVLLVLGVLMRRRPLELGTGIISRTGKGGLAIGSSLRGLALLVPGAFREAAEGLIYALGLMSSDPSAELASWLILALTPPHGPEAGTWVSLKGLSAAGFFSLPEDLRAAIRALSAKGCIEADRSIYPPRVRMSAKGPEIVRELMSGGR